ncbi:MAG: proton-conducting membrane transporter [Acidimicrobiia bacterium]|nr:proton-conducting membrane transporter [Acidimicrobiia bacterium]
MAAAPVLAEPEPEPQPEREPELPTPTLPRLLAGVAGGASPVPFATHRHQYPAPPQAGRPLADITNAVERSGLRGRGGAGFPTARKLRAVAERHSRLGRKPIVVVNGSEGEPASKKDILLLTRNPHLVLDGALLAAAAVGATDVVVCIDRHATAALNAVYAAIAERAAHDERTAQNIRVAAIPHHYVAGEESALVHWLNGGEAKPTLTPPRPFESGVGGRPTLVDNVETLAHVAQIVRWGPEWFRDHGTEDEPGTMLVTITGAVSQVGVHEVPVGARLSTVIRNAGGSLSKASAVLVGGYFGAWLSPEQARHTRLCEEDLRPLGAGLGCGAIVVLGEDACGLRETARILGWLATESAGQCGSCVHGLAALAGGTVDLFRGDDAADRLLRWAGQVERRGACHLPNGAVRLLRSGLATFADEIDHHRAGRGCRGGPSVLPIPDTRREPWQ